MFLSAAAASARYMKVEVEAAVREFGDRIIFAWLDRSQSLPRGFPVPETEWPVLHCQYDESRLDWNEIDRLIVSTNKGDGYRLRGHARGLEGH